MFGYISLLIHASCETSRMHIWKLATSDKGPEKDARRGKILERASPVNLSVPRIGTHDQLSMLIEVKQSINHVVINHDVEIFISQALRYSLCPPLYVNIFIIHSE